MLTMDHCALSFVKMLNESKTFVKEQMQNIVDDYILLKQTKNSDIVCQTKNNSNHWLLAQICENAYTNIAYNVMKHSIIIPCPILWQTTKHV